MTGPVKVYTPRPFTGRTFWICVPSMALVYLAYSFSSRGISDTIGASLVVTGLLAGSLFMDIFNGRVWVHLYPDYLDFQGPVSHLLEQALGWRLGATRIPYPEITALAHPANEEVLFFLVIHRGAGFRRRKFFIPCSGSPQYQDLKSELLKRLPAGCTLYAWKEFGRRGAF